jgi:hypothetical protein
MALVRSLSVVRRLSVVALFSVSAVEASNAAQLTLSWTDNARGTASFDVERRRQGTSTFGTIADVPAGTTRYVDREILEGITYCYRVRAYNAFGDSPYTPEACAAAAVSTYTVSVRKLGNGYGTVVADGNGIRCGNYCEATYRTGQLVTLFGIAASGSSFAGWTGGGCAGVAPCVITGNAAITVSATFRRASAGLDPLIRPLIASVAVPAPLPGLLLSRVSAR